MFVPQFSIRLLMIVTAIVAVFAMVASWGGNGVGWAAAATMALAMAVVAVLVLAATFGIVSLMSPMVRADEPPNLPPRLDVRSTPAINPPIDIPSPIQPPESQA